VLGSLASRNQAGIHSGLVEVLFHHSLALLDDAGDAVTVFASYFLVEGVEHLLQALDLSGCLFQVCFERLAKISRAGRSGHLGQCLHELLFSVVGVTQFVNECVMQGAVSVMVVSP
jgi:hypothetical protein